MLAAPGRYVILDTETTGLAPADEVIQVAVIDLLGRVLLDTLVRPLHRTSIPPEAARFHGITMAMLAGAPAWPQVAASLLACTGQRTIISYNAEFDARLLRQTAQRNGGPLPAARWECAMQQYARYYGEWDRGKGGYRWQRLTGGDHSALGDCRATLALIRKMAGV